MYNCSHCDAQYLKWEGRCNECGKWGTVIEETSVATTRGRAVTKKAVAQKSARLFEISKESKQERLKTNDPEIDRVLGNGIIPGSLILLSGEPGIGKSTMVAAIASSVISSGPGPDVKNSAKVSTPSGPGPDAGVLYISGEESPAQLANRFDRLGSDFKGINVLEVFPIETIVATIEKEKPVLAIIDSVQTLTSSEIDSTAGSPAMVRYATSLLLELSKRSNIPILLIGQVTKDGSVAGPKTLEHMVDVVLNLEGDPVHSYRLLRAGKNRFGATDEVGVFEMTANGLLPVSNPSEQFLKERVAVPGSVITATVEGSRVFLVEVQALVEKSSFGMPVRRASGFDQNRLQMLSAILSKRAGMKLSEKDIYINVIGGLSLKEPAADLAVCAAIASADSGQLHPDDGRTHGSAPTVYIGEVGLGGEIRSVPFLEKRIEEAKRFGIDKVVSPKSIKELKDLL